jgi:archaetidylinositol phosphate synthase
MNNREYLERWSSLHGYPSGQGPTGIARGYLLINFYLAKPFVVLRIPADVVSLIGLLLACFALLGRNTLWAPIFILLSVISDGLDGAVAIARNRASKWGALWDSTLDRIVEALWVLTAYFAGVPTWALLIAWCAAATQEYARARLSSLVNNEIGVVSICERPVRAIFIAIALALGIYNLDLQNISILLWMVFQLAALAQVIKYSYQRLQNSSAS